MTVNNSANKVIIAGNGVQVVFSFSFIAVDAADLTVILTDAAGNETTLPPAQYSVALNAVPAGQIWALGGTVTYPLVGSPIPTGSTLTIVRELSLTQLVALGNQGNEFPGAVETALDLLEMQLQQVNELFQRAIVAPVVDPAAPLPLPPAAQRANLGMGFDSFGNPIAMALPASGVISSAMQPVVNAATRAAGRAAFGLGGIAVEGIGAGLQDDGAGNVRVNSAFTQDGTNQNVVAAFHLSDRIATGTLNYNLPRANTLWNGFSFAVYVAANTVTFVPNPADAILGLSSGAALVLAAGYWYTIGTDAANSGNWFIYQMRAPVGLISTSQIFLGSQSGTYTTPKGCRQIRVRYCGGGGASGPTTPVTGAAGVDSSFNSVLAKGGGGGTGNNGATGGLGGNGGNGGTSTALIRRYRGQDGDSGASSSTASVTIPGARGGSTAFYGGGGRAGFSVTGGSPVPNSGAGGGGYAGSGAGNAGAGGAAECVELIINNPAASYAFVIGAGGAVSGSFSIAGADGQMSIDEYY